MNREAKLTALKRLRESEITLKQFKAIVTAPTAARQNAKGEVLIHGTWYDPKEIGFKGLAIMTTQQALDDLNSLRDID